VLDDFEAIAVLIANYEHGHLRRRYFDPPRAVARWPIEARVQSKDIDVEAQSALLVCPGCFTFKTSGLVRNRQTLHPMATSSCIALGAASMLWPTGRRLPQLLSRSPAALTPT
jgi:hypothetical protein